MTQEQSRNQIYKKEILDGILSYARAEGVDLTRKQADTAFNGLIHTLFEALSQGKRVNIIKFGSLEVRHRPKRPSWDMHRKEMVMREAHNYVHFSMGTSLDKKIQDVQFELQKNPNGKSKYVIKNPVSTES